MTLKIEERTKAIEVIAKRNVSMGDQVQEGTKDVNGHDISGLVPEGFGSQSKIIIDNNTKEVVGIQRVSTEDDQKFIQRYINFLENDLTQEPLDPV